MSNVLVDLIPFIIGGMVVPVQLIIMLMLLKNPQNGTQKGLLFFTGLTVVRLLQGIVFGLILNIGASGKNEDGKGVIVSTLLLVLGILLLISAYKKFTKQPDPEDETPKWMENVVSASGFRTFLYGIQLPLMSPKLWVFMLSAIGTIAVAQLGPTISYSTFLVFVLLTQAILLLLVMIRLLLPKNAVSILTSASTWLANNNRTIMIVFSLVFGIYFTYQGIYGLTA
ncbi:MAG: GAP family protein [Anaerolineaceae bacterium]|nr:GAP family protein [Anaerolineaceae bacterium]